MTFAELQAKNPNIRLYHVTDPAFAPYGRIIEADTADMVACMEAIPMPESGARYVPTEETLEKAPLADFIRAELFGDVPAQIGYCWGESNRLNALEWHICNEINLPATDLVLLLALRSELVDNRIDAEKVVGFYVPRGTLIEVYSTSLHYCPCQVEDGGFRCLVGLTKETNTPLRGKPADPLLFARNKWLIAHDENEALIARGAVPGISGENYTVKR